MTKEMSIPSIATIAGALAAAACCILLPLFAGTAIGAALVTGAFFGLHEGSVILILVLLVAGGTAAVVHLHRRNNASTRLGS